MLLNSSNILIKFFHNLLWLYNSTNDVSFDDFLFIKCHKVNYNNSNTNNKKCVNVFYRIEKRKQII